MREVRSTILFTRCFEIVRRRVFENASEREREREREMLQTIRNVMRCREVQTHQVSLYAGMGERERICEWLCICVYVFADHNQQKSSRGHCWVRVFGALVHNPF